MPQVRSPSTWRYRRRASMEGNRSGGQGAVRSGLLTGVSTAAVSGSAAGLGVILARKFGHGVKTDGSFAAYGVYPSVLLVARSLGVRGIPRFAAASAADRLPPELTTWMAAFAAPHVALMVVGV